MQTCASGLFAAVHDLLDGLELSAVKVVLHALNTVFQTAPASTWVEALDASGCFSKFLQVISGTVSRLDFIAVRGLTNLPSLERAEPFRLDCHKM